MNRIEMTTRLFAAAVLLSAACAATAETRGRLRENLARHEQHAGAPIDEIRNFRLYRWSPLGPHELAIWANPGALYLVRVEPPCDGLDFAHAIGTTGLTRSLSARFDAIVFERKRCTIRSIQPVDYRRMRDDAKAAAAGDKQPR